MIETCCRTMRIGENAGQVPIRCPVCRAGVVETVRSRVFGRGLWLLMIWLVGVGNRLGYFGGDEENNSSSSDLRLVMAWVAIVGFRIDLWISYK